MSDPGEVPAALASFYALGAKRNGWLYHRSLAGRSESDRAALTVAGLDVARLEREGRLVFSEMEPHIGVEDYVHGWDAEMDAALERGFDAVWCARFPVGPDTAVIDRSIEYDRAWETHAHDRRYVSLCIYVVGDPERDRRAVELAPIHDMLLE